MQAQRKTVAFLLPGILLFFGMAVMLIRLPSEYPLIAFLLFIFILVTAVVISIEMASVFGVFVTIFELAGIGLVQGSDKGWLAAHMAVLWVAVFLTQRFTQQEILDEQACSDVLRDRQQALLSLQKEKESLDRRLTDLDNQASLRQHLFNAVHQLASLLDPVMVRQRLMEFVRSTITRGTIHYFAGNVPRDPMDRWVMERKLSVLVTDVGQDNRFKAVRSNNEIRSVLAAPIVVERQLVGIIRLNGFEPDLFSIGDLRILEALSLLAVSGA